MGQLSEQQSKSELHGWLAVLQSPGAVQWFVESHTAEQQAPAVAAVQATPAPSQGGVGGVPQVWGDAGVQYPVQHSESAVQLTSSSAQGVETQMLFAQLAVQQFAATLQSSPAGPGVEGLWSRVHEAGSMHDVPLHAPRQQSDGFAHAALVAAHCPSGFTQT